MNRKEVETGRRLLRGIAERTEAYRFERTSRGRKILSWCLSVQWRDGSGGKIYYHFGDILQRLHQPNLGD